MSSYKPKKLKGFTFRKWKKSQALKKAVISDQVENISISSPESSLCFDIETLEKQSNKTLKALCIARRIPRKLSRPERIAALIEYEHPNSGSILSNELDKE